MEYQVIIVLTPAVIRVKIVAYILSRSVFWTAKWQERGSNPGKASPVIEMLILGVKWIEIPKYDFVRGFVEAKNTFMSTYVIDWTHDKSLTLLV